MDDLISRQTAINAIDGLQNCYNGYSDSYDKSYIIGVLEELPSAEPKAGKWVNNINDIPICNQCGYMTPYDRAIDDYEYGNYCPHCGAKMEGEEGE